MNLCQDMTTRMFIANVLLMMKNGEHPLWPTIGNGLKYGTVIQWNALQLFKNDEIEEYLTACKSVHHILSGEKLAPR